MPPRKQPRSASQRPAAKRPAAKRPAAKRPAAKRPAPPRATPPELVIQRLTPRRMDDLRRVQSGGWGSSCWCMHPRLTPAQERALPSAGGAGETRRAAMEALARRRRAPGLLAYEGDEVVGWVAIAPRQELGRIAASRATPPVDELPVWVIACITVRKAARGRGVALALIAAAVAYAREQGAPAVEAYPRAGAARVHDDFAYYGTQRLFARAGFEVVREPLAGLPRNWTPRVTMRLACADDPA